MTPSLSFTFAPPITAMNGRSGSSRSANSVPTSRSRFGPPALGTIVGGTMIEAWARCDAPKASLT